MKQITIDRALLEQAIAALSYCEPDCEENTHGFDLWANVLPPLREALAQPQPVQQDRVAELEAANAELLDALKMNAQALSWLAFGECSGFTAPLPTALEATGAASAAIKKHGGVA